MEYLLLAGLGAIILITIVGWFTRQKAAGAGRKIFTGNVESSGRVSHAIAQPMTNAAHVAAPTHADLKNEVRALVAGGQIIQAVKLVRERTSLGLKEAKDMVDHVEDGARSSAPAISSMTFGNTHINVDDEARRLVAAGSKIEAIKLVRERTGLGLKEAKDYVERL
jgi:ribosomal protein L7/L12